MQWFQWQPQYKSEVDVDLEDLEARLYSQVYHVSHEEHNNSPQKVESYNISDSQNVTRYYKMGIKQYHQIALPSNSSEHTPVPSRDNINMGQLAVSPFINNQTEAPTLVPQVINMVNPINNFVVLPQTTPYFLRANALRPYMNKNFEKFLKRQTARLKKSTKRKMQRERKRNLKATLPPNNPNFGQRVFETESLNEQNLQTNSKSTTENECRPQRVTIQIPEDEVREEGYGNIPTEVIESDSDSIIVIKDESSLIVLSSDESDLETTKNNRFKSESASKKLERVGIVMVEDLGCSDKKVIETDDDVIFVEPKPVEIIEIDIEPLLSVVDLDGKCIADADASKQQYTDKSTETSSSHSTDTFIKLRHSDGTKTKQNMTSKERRELLYTPDSTTSNDFLVNPLEAPQDRFNFGLHDSDFSNSQIFTKPKTHADAYETESSCSTSDISSTPIKTALFNEVEFETPIRQLFEDTNLEGFGDYITPSRSGSCGIPSILNTEFEQVKTKVSKSKCELQFGSASNSESEAEVDASKASYLDAKKTQQVLPNLCPIEDNSGTTKTKASKTKKKKSSSSLGDDSLVKPTGSKRKSNFGIGDVGEDEIQKRSKPSNCETIKNQPVDDQVVSTKKSNQNDSKRSKSNRKGVHDRNQSPEVIENVATESCSAINIVEETNQKQVKIKMSDEAETIIFDFNEVEIVNDTTGNKETVVENALENMVSSNFIIVDETVDEKNDSLFEAQLSDCEELADDLALANCGSGSQHTKQSEVIKKRTRFADYWIADSNKFHNRSWGLENFSVEETQKSMSDDPDLWKIVDRDRVFVRLSTPRGQRCRRCREIGHVAFRCRNKPAVPSCNLCGTKGHIEPRCPNAVCTTCGSHGGYCAYCSKCAHWKSFQCRLCKMYGHLDWGCPDLWRRYHLTTKPGPIVVPEKTRGKLFQEKWCCSCAKFGHYEHNCRYVNRIHPCSTSDIKKYCDVYNFPKLQANITLNESIEANESIVVEEDSDRHLVVEEATSKECQEANTTQTIEENTVASSDMASRSVILIDDINNDNESQIYPPNHMIPLYFQQQLSYLKFATPSTSESARIDETTTKVSAMIALKADQETNCSGEQHSKRILLLAHKFAYLHSCKGTEYLNKIRAQSSVSITVKRSSPDSAEAGVVILHGNTEKVEMAANDFNNFLNHATKINIRIIPKDSDVLYNFLFKFLKELHFTKGNSKVLFDSIMEKKRKLSDTGNTNHRLKQAIFSLYLRLNMLLFGKCKVQQGQKNVAILESWLESTRNKQFVVELTDRFDIYEAYMYVYKSQRSDDEYASLCEAANYHVGCEKPANSVHPMGKKQRLHFTRKIKEIMRNCRRFNLKEELRQVINIQAAVHKSNYSTTAYQDFLKFVNHFTKYFCNIRNSKA